MGAFKVGVLLLVLVVSSVHADTADAAAGLARRSKVSNEQETSAQGGICLGNDSRCVGASKLTCEQWQAANVDCQWLSNDGDEELGQCLGNDERCPNKAKSECEYLGSTGAHCEWLAYDDIEDGEYGAETEIGGLCLGADSRCAGKTKIVCHWLRHSEGVDCMWTPDDHEADFDDEEPEMKEYESESAWSEEAGYDACTGADTACAGKSMIECGELEASGVQCSWTVPEMTFFAAGAGAIPDASGGFAGAEWEVDGHKFGGPGFLIETVKTVLKEDQDSVIEV